MPNKPPTVAPAIVAVGVDGGEIGVSLEAEIVVDGVAERVFKGEVDGLEMVVKSIKCHRVK